MLTCIIDLPHRFGGSDCDRDDADMQRKSKEISSISYVHADHKMCCYCQCKHSQQTGRDEPQDSSSGGQ